MKKLITNINPFALLLIPVLFAMIIGVSSQIKLKNYEVQGTTASTYTKATSLFTKSVGLIKTVCSVAKQNVW